MLLGLDPALSPELLYVLARMGHGDEIALVDANFPAETMGQRVVRMDGLQATEVLRAVLSLLPLDDFVDEAALTMEVVGDSDSVPPAVADFRELIGDRTRCGTLERFAFYDRARAAFAVVQTGETRIYGNVLLKKGVIGAP